MERNYFKIIFIIFLIGIILFAIYINLFGNKKNIDKITETLQMKSSEKIIDNDLRIGIIEFDNINPILSNNKNVQDVSRIIYDSLFTLTEDYQIKESLAKDYSKLNDVTYLIKLKENIKWQDGSEFNVSDVVFTIDMIKELGNNSIYFYNVKDISEIEEIDEYTLKITIDNKIPYFEYNLIFPILSSKYYTKDDFILESKNIKPTGTGMFYISEVTENKILLNKNVTYWGDSKAIQLDTITINLYDSLSSIINAFKAGEVDIFTTSNMDIENYLKNTSYIKKEYINRNCDYIILNCSNQIMSNKEVRQAINSSINKDEIIKNVYSGKYYRSNFPLDFGSFAYNKNNTIIAYDENVAKRLLLDAGWKYTSKRWNKTLNHRYLKIELNLLVEKKNKNRVKVANQIKEQLEKVGIKVKIIEANENQYYSFLKNKNYDILLTGGTYGYSPSLNKYFKDENLANYQNNIILDILNQIENETDINKIKENVTQIVDIYNDEVPYINLYYDVNIAIYSTNLKGNIMPNSYNLFYGIENWHREYEKNTK